MNRRFAAGLVLAVASFVARRVTAQTTYNVVPLYGFSNTPASGRVYSVNSQGTAVGQSFKGDQQNNHIEPALWMNGASGPASDIGSPLDKAGEALDVSDSGVIVGWAYNSSTRQRPTIYQNGTFSELPTLGGASGEARSINNSGTIAGRSDDSTGRGNATIWVNGIPSSLGFLGGTSAEANGINSAGHVVGYSNNSQGQQRPFLYRNGVMENLGLPGGATQGTAVAVNNVDKVVGVMNFPAGVEHAFFWDNGVFTDLDTFGSKSRANGINALGQVVGNATKNGPVVAFSWTATGGLLDLNTKIPSNSGWFLVDAKAINDAGWIAASGVKDGFTQPVLLIPVPEPTSAIVVATACLLFMKRRLCHGIPLA